MRRSERQAWGQKVFEHMKAAGIHTATLIALAGVRYVEPLVWVGLTPATPLEGLRIGEQLAWLSDR